MAPPSDSDISTTSDDDFSTASSPKKPTTSKSLPHIISSSRRPLTHQLFFLFICVKVAVVVLAHIAINLVPANNTATNLILFRHADLNKLDSLLKDFVTPFIRWDAIHMLTIARDGYNFETQFAFFPLLPMVSRYLASSLLQVGNLKNLISFEVLICLFAILITNSCHFFAILFLFKLTAFLFKSTRFAMISSILFMFNPAAIQLSSMYTESPFAFFTFVGLYAFYKKNKLTAALLWSLATLTRSNGIVLIGFFFYDFLSLIFGTTTTTTTTVKNKLSFSGVKVINEFCLTILYSLISVSSFIGFQFFAFTQFCRIDPNRPWCQDVIPNIYSFVQKEYWNVGLFNYFKITQIPNFLIALPMITICSAAIFIYFDADHLRFISLGLYRSNNKRAKSLKLFLSNPVLPHIYLLTFMLLHTTRIAHVQIITRVFTFMPVIYWFMAHIMMTANIRIQKTLQTYIGLYGLIGTVLFATNHPPA